MLKKENFFSAKEKWLTHLLIAILFGIVSFYSKSRWQIEQNSNPGFDHFEDLEKKH